jgi:anti-anti-sigma factor
MLTFNYNHEENIITFIFNGRMDTLAMEKLNKILHSEDGLKEIKPEQKIEFDLREVYYIASSFIRICVGHAKQVGSERFSIANCQPFVKKTFKISGLDDVLSIS